MRLPEGSRLWERLPVLLLAVAVVTSGVLLIRLDSQLTFVADDWIFLVKRDGWSADVFLLPSHGNLIVGLGFAYRLLREIFGMGSATPYYVVSIGCFLGSVIALFYFLRRRVGDWLALLAAVLILFLGAAFEDLLFAFQLGYFASVFAGLGALIALDRDDSFGDVVACALLTVSVAFASLGIPFLAGATVKLLLDRGWGRHLLVVLAPILLLGLWWLGWGHDAGSKLSGSNTANTPGYVFDAASAGIVSLLGLAAGDGSEPEQPHLIWGHVFLVVGMVLLIVKITREGKIPAGLAVALAMGVTFWVLAGINRDASRPPASSRYQYPSAVFLLLIVGEMIRGFRVPRVAVIVVAAITGGAIIGGISLLLREHDERWVPYADSLRSNLAAVEIAGPSGNPDFTVNYPPNISSSARDYLAATRRYGSPAFSESELVARPETERAAADLKMAQALGLEIAPPEPGVQTVGCQTLQATPLGETGITLLHGGFTLDDRGEAEVALSLGRFSEGLPVNFGSLAPHTPVSLYIPEDRSERPWRLGLTGSGPVRLCTTG